MAGIVAAIIIIAFGIFSILYTNHEDKKEAQLSK